MTTVFDADYYLRTNADVAASGMDAMRHYILYGSREGRNPSPLFDAHYYLEQISIPASFPFSPLAHFLLVGRHERVSPSPWFDYSFYERHHPEVMTRRICPYLHFLQHGLWRNWQACVQFDPTAYLQEHPEVPEDTPALLHFLRKQESQAAPSATGARLPRWLAMSTEANAKTPEAGMERILEELENLEGTARGPAADAAAVHIILPVYDGLDTTLRTLHSVFTSRNATPWTLTVINDCSPNARLSRILRSLAEKLPFRLIEHERNAGFVRTVNEGMSLHPQLDVVLLNADTEVYGNWLDRLRTAAQSTDNVASVTPLSNNATICSYPQFLQNNVAPLELPWAELDTLAAKVNAGMCVQAPTGVGFCMYITRRALNETGLFDAETFGRGYGEENDFCQRAEKQGFVNLLAADVFVRHVGGVSFGSDKRRLMEHAVRAMNQKHPGYDARVQEFIRRDPLRQARANLDLARLKRLRKGRNVLFLGLTRGGGAELAMHRHMLQEKAAGKSVFAFVPTGEGSRVRIMHMDAGNLPNMPILDLDTQKDEAIRLLRELEIGLVEIHHLIDLSMQAPQALPDICSAAGIPYHFHVHDYLAICPRTNLIDQSGIYCGEQGVQQCRACLKGFSFKGQAVDIAEWRRMYGNLLRGAARVIAPSMDVSCRLRRHFADVKALVQPHEAPVKARMRLPKRNADAPLHIAVLGAIGSPKGANVLLALARHIRKKRLPVRLSVIGHTSLDAQLRRLGVHITGPYSDDYVQELIAETDPDCILFPSVCPETYGFALSHALRSGRPIAAFDLGAQAERMHGLPHALLLPLELHGHPGEILERIVNWMADLRHLYSRRTLHFREPRSMPDARREQKDYIIFFTPRSGSSYLTSTLASTGCLGNPDEWINPQWVDKVMKKLEADTPEQLIEVLRKKKRSRNGVFGLEATYFHLAQCNLEESESFMRFCRESLIFLLLRRDIVKQAISLYKAVETNLFHVTNDDLRKRREDMDECVEYDAQKIRQWTEHILIQEKGIVNVLQRIGKDVVILFYEDIVSISPQELATRFADMLEIDLMDKPCRQATPRHEKVSTPKNDLFHARFISENGQFIEKIHEERGFLRELSSFSFTSPNGLKSC